MTNWSLLTGPLPPPVAACSPLNRNLLFETQEDSARVVAGKSQLRFLRESGRFGKVGKF